MIQATLYEEKKKWISYQNIARSLALNGLSFGNWVSWFTAPKASTGPQAERGDLSVVFDTTLHFSSV